jgi:hypothetical protein
MSAHYDPREFQGNRGSAVAPQVNEGVMKSSNCFYQESVGQVKSTEYDVDLTSATNAACRTAMFSCKIVVRSKPTYVAIGDIQENPIQPKFLKQCMTAI